MVYKITPKELQGRKAGGYRGNIAADELNKQGFDAVTIEGGYSAWKDEEKKKQENSSNSNE
jgi:hypothetical protein